MSTFTTIVIFIVILFACVSVLAIIQRREQEKQVLRQKIAQYRYRSNQAMGILTKQASMPIGPEARKIILQYAIGNLLAIKKLAPQDANNEKNIETLKQQANNPESPADKQKLVIPNDPNLLKAQINTLSNLAKFLLKLNNNPAVNATLIPVAVKRIMALISESKICAYIQQGQECLSKHEYVPAQRNFTMAQQMLAKVPEKNARLQQLHLDLQELIKSSPTEALNTQLSFNDEVPKQTAEEPEEDHDELFGPKKKW